MKIQNISPLNKTFQTRNFQKTNSLYQFKFQNMPYDTVSFGSKQVDVKDMINTIRESKEIQAEGSKVYQNAQALIPSAKEKFQDSYNAYLLACKYLKIASKNLTNPYVELSNGDVLSFKFIVGKSDFSVQMDVFDGCENKKYSITTKGLNPVQVIEYSDEEGAVIYQYSNNHIVISDNMALFGDNVGVSDANYVFIDGQLSSIRTNVNHKTMPQTSDEFYYYVDDKLAIAELDNSMNLVTGVSNNKQRYTFINSKLFNYYDNFTARGRSRISFDESFHFINDTFLAHTLNSKQVDGSGAIVADSAVYSKSGKFFKADGEKFRIKDAGAIKFDEN